MELAYRTRLVNRWDGTPCKDRVDDLGLTWFTPFTVEKAREAVRLMGFTPKNDDANDCIREDLELGSIEIMPTRDGAESAWIDFAR